MFIDWKQVADISKLTVLKNRQITPHPAIIVIPFDQLESHLRRLLSQACAPGGAKNMLTGYGPPGLLF